jgi:hypothetical protein
MTAMLSMRVNLYHQPSTSLLVLPVSLRHGIQYISSDAFLGCSTDVRITAEQNWTTTCVTAPAGPGWPVKWRVRVTELPGKRSQLVEFTRGPLAFRRPTQQVITSMPNCRRHATWSCASRSYGSAARTAAC